MLPFYYSYFTSPLGILRIKATESSIYEVIFTDELHQDDLHQPSVILECKRQLAEFFESKRRTFELNINPDGTPFQHKVWDLLQTLPFGEKTTYQKLAELTGDAKNTRALANAIGKNPLAIIIPCHRVIGSNGSLTGYAWGLVRKSWLLDYEAKATGQFMKLF